MRNFHNSMKAKSEHCSTLKNFFKLRGLIMFYYFFNSEDLITLYIILDYLSKVTDIAWKEGGLTIFFILV
jgi:hypothetical protein